MLCCSFEELIINFGKVRIHKLSFWRLPLYSSERSSSAGLQLITAPLCLSYWRKPPPLLRFQKAKYFRVTALRGCSRTPAPQRTRSSLSVARVAEAGDRRIFSSLAPLSLRLFWCLRTSGCVSQGPTSSAASVSRSVASVALDRPPICGPGLPGPRRTSKKPRQAQPCFSLASVSVLFFLLSADLCPHLSGTRGFWGTGFCPRPRWPRAVAASGPEGRGGVSPGAAHSWGPPGRGWPSWLVGCHHSGCTCALPVVYKTPKRSRGGAPLRSDPAKRSGRTRGARVAQKRKRNEERPAWLGEWRSQVG